jgi:hypothetical protein
MASSEFIRWSGLAAVIGGVLFSCYGLNIRERSFV